MPKFTVFLHRHHWAVLTGVIVLLMVLTFYRRVPVDDAYISFRYAQNFEAGQGLVWNAGERVEGYTNFLWTVIIAAGFKMGVQPEIWTVIIAMPLHLLGLLFLYFTARNVLKPLDSRGKNTLIDSRLGALLTVLWVGSNNSLNAFATSGLESPLIFFLYCAVFWLVSVCVERGWSASRSFGMGILLAMALLTRLDSGLLALGVFLIFISDLRNRPEINPSRPWLNFLAFSLPLVALVAPWLLWKLQYYGSIFPNSYRIKVEPFQYAGYGLFYLYLFMLSHLFFVFAVMLGWHGKIIARQSRAVGYALIFILIWALYMVYVGGDFMEFRFLIPILPLLGIATVYTLQSLFTNPRVLAALVTMLFLGNLNGTFALEKTVYTYGVEKVEKLAVHLEGEGQDWIRIGKRLKELFGGTDVKIAIGAAGAIPYYSELPAVDFMGLCDPVIPDIAEYFSMVPGHRVVAPLEYIVNTGANLVIEPNNFLMSRKKLQSWLRTANWADLDRMYLDIEKPVNGRLLNEVTMIVLPIDDNYELVVWYLNPHPAVEAAIVKWQLNRIRLVRR